MQEKLSIAAIIAVVTAVFTTALVMSLMGQAANAVCTKSGVCAVTNPPESITASSNTHAISGNVIGGSNAADNNKGDTNSHSGATKCAFTPEAGSVCAP